MTQDEAIKELKKLSSKCHFPGDVRTYAAVGILLRVLEATGMEDVANEFRRLRNEGVILYA